MTALGAPVARAECARTPFALRATVLALARVEGARLIRHPMFLAGAALSVLFSLSFAADWGVGGDYLVLIGAGSVPLGLGTLAASNLAALRSRRAETGELYVSIAAPAHARTMAHLLALAWPVAVAAALVAASFAWFEAWHGLDITREGHRATPEAVQLAQGPLAVATLGALGIALARWIPQAAAAMLAVVGLLVAHMMFVMWNSQQAVGWFLPVVNPARNAVDASWPCANDQTWPCILDGFAALHWHLVYLVALVALLGALALLRDGRRRRDLLLAASSSAVVVVAGVLQLP